MRQRPSCLGSGGRRRLLVSTSFALIFISGLCLRCNSLTTRWSGGPRSFNGAFYSIIARNYLRYGFLESRFQPVMDTFPDPENLRYYLHHPPLLGLLTACSFRFLGESELSARILPILFSAANLLLVFLLIRGPWGTQTALLGMFFAAFFTMAAFYGPQVEVFGSMVLFFILASYMCYRRWLSTSDRRGLGLSLALFALAMATAWTGYLTLLLVAIETTRRRKGLRHYLRCLLPYIALAVSMFGLHLLGIWSVTGNVLGGEWVPSLLFRLNIGTRAQAYTFSLLEYAVRIKGYLVGYFGLPALIVAVVGTVSLKSRGQHQNEDSRRALVLNLAVLGCLYPIVFTNASYIHDYSVLNLVPLLALLAAVGTARLLDTLARWRKPLGYLCVGAICLSHALLNVRVLTYMRSQGQSDRYYELGDYLKRHTRAGEVVLTSFGRKIEYDYYTDRKIIPGVASLDHFRRVHADEPNPIACYVTTNAHMDTALSRHLSTTFKQQRLREHTVFDLRSELVLDNPTRPTGGMRQP